VNDAAHEGRFSTPFAFCDKGIMMSWCGSIQATHQALREGWSGAKSALKWFKPFMKGKGIMAERKRPD
jgi:hypothetical protein